MSHGLLPNTDYGANLAPGGRHPAAYAADPSQSRGRLFAQTDCQTRSPFQRDRDRIIHASAFRRLTHKTQVFVFHEGDHYRTRLTHSLEVAQIARTVARQLCLDEDLAETLALAHDLGHPPFGHAGERALELANATHGGFDHNAQSFRVVTALERRYADFDGLNLTWETLEGLIKHNGPLVNAKSSATRRVLKQVERWQSFDLELWPCAEAQVAALADDIAYATHDIDDGLRAGLISMEDLAAAPIASGIIASLGSPQSVDDLSRRHFEVSRQMITRLINDLVVASRDRLRALKPQTPQDIRQAGRAVIGFSAPLEAELAALKAFLFARVYRHERVVTVMQGAERIVGDLYRRYLDDNATLPAPWLAAAGRLDQRRRGRLVADFVAGMTDRFALVEHRRLFDATPLLR
jgi:dGTPase